MLRMRSALMRSAIAHSLLVLFLTDGIDFRDEIEFEVFILSHSLIVDVKIDALVAMVSDGLTDAFQGYHMGITAEKYCGQSLASPARLKTSSPTVRRLRQLPLSMMESLRVRL